MINKGIAMKNQFKVGCIYAESFICNADNFYSFTVISRTACTITVKDKHGKIKKMRISKKYSAYKGVETVLPFGDYSMAMLIDADDIKAA